MIHTVIHPQGPEVTLTIPPEYIGKDLELGADSFCRRGRRDTIDL